MPKTPFAMSMIVIVALATSGQARIDQNPIEDLAECLGVGSDIVMPKELPLFPQGPNGGGFYINNKLSERTLAYFMEKDGEVASGFSYRIWGYTNEADCSGISGPPPTTIDGLIDWITDITGNTDWILSDHLPCAPQEDVENSCYIE